MGAVQHRIGLLAGGRSRREESREEAARHDVLPLDWRSVERLSEQITGRPSLATGRTKFVYTTPLVALPEGSAPDLKNKSFTVTAEPEIPPSGADGMIFTQGGITAGWGFYLPKGKLVGVHNYIGLERYRITTENVPTGEVTLTFDFKYDGGGMSKGGTIALLANGKKIGEGRVEKTAGFTYSLYERAGHRRGHRLADRLLLHAAVQVRRAARQGDGRAKAPGSDTRGPTGRAGAADRPRPDGGELNRLGSAESRRRE